MSDDGNPSDVRLDAAGLRVLAHPLRSRLLTLLRTEGPATATRLARSLETNTGATSYHLRRLAEVGLIEDTQAGRGRERVWQATTRTHSWYPSELSEDPDAQAAVQWLDRYYLATFVERYQRWLATASGWPADWQDGAGLADTALSMTSEELISLRRDLEQLIERYRTAATARQPDRRPDRPSDEPDPHRRTVAVYTFAFPSDPDRPPEP